MSKLKELLDELCPNGVEYKPLGSIASISRGGSFQKKDFRDKGVPCIHYGQIYTQYGLFVKETLQYIGVELSVKQKMATTNDIIMAVTSENMEDVCKCVAWLGEGEIAVSGHTAIIRHNQNAKYLTYYFHTEMFASQKKKLAHGTKVIEVTPDTLANIIVPVPPLPVQAEIVRILDAFTKLTAQLDAELVARRKQYAYYRDLLLSFDYSSTPPPIPWKCTKNQIFLGSFAKFTYGYTDKAQKVGDARFIRITDIDENGCLNVQDAKYIHLSEENRAYLLKRGDLLVARTGATYGKTLYIPNDAPAVYASFLIKITLDENVMTNRFYWHFAQSSFYWEQANRLVSTGSQPQFNAGAICRISVPVPPLDEQRRIVAILDR